MAIVNFSSAVFNLNFLSSGSQTVQASTSATPDTYTWTTVPSGLTFLRYSLTSTAGNITAGPPPTGTINAISTTYFNGADYLPAFTITGLATSVSNLVDTTTPSNTFGKFWNTVLAGATDLILPIVPAANVSIAGDFVTVTGAMAGSADRFLGVALGTSIGTFVGDAFTTGVGTSLTGGDDLFQHAQGTLVGDVYSAQGAVFGGDDTFDLAYAYSPVIIPFVNFAIGDVLQFAAPTANFRGGTDLFTMSNVASFGSVTGDGYSLGGARTAYGGSDTILLSRAANSTFHMIGDTILGDFFVLVDVTDNSAATIYDARGGNDRIALTNVNLSGATRALAGDVYQASASAAGSFLGGNDTITLNATLTSPIAPPPPPSLNFLDGDAHTLSAGTIFIFRGGNDSISTTNTVVSQQIVGDVGTLNSPMGGTLQGGNDTIVLNWTRLDTAANYSLLAGDSTTAVVRVFLGGNDNMLFKGTILGASGNIFGDSQVVTTPLTTANHVGGDDIINVNIFSPVGQAIYGDFLQAFSAGGTLKGGNDRIYGSNGNDTIYGDAAAFGGYTSITGGTDTLDGRGGNDRLDGGFGRDTVEFSLAQGVYVNLGGIAGSNPAVPGDPFEAIGQGFDQLIDIENVTGSSKDDVIIGNAQANVLIGGAGNDELDGGNDAFVENLQGGLGNDRYILLNRNDNIVDSGGLDTIYSTIGRNLSFASFLEVENLVLQGAAGNGTGNALANTIFGNAIANTLTGAAGKDTLIGYNGADIIIGGNGADRLGGGQLAGNEAVASRDIFRYTSISDSGTTVAGADTILFFDKGAAATDDRFDFVPLDGNTAVAGNQGFAFRGAAAFSQAGGEVRVVTVGADSHVFVDTDADAAAEMMIVVKGVTGLLAGDFFL